VSVSNNRFRHIGGGILLWLLVVMLLVSIIGMSWLQLVLFADHHRRQHNDLFELRSKALDFLLESWCWLETNYSSDSLSHWTSFDHAVKGVLESSEGTLKRAWSITVPEYGDFRFSALNTSLTGQGLRSPLPVSVQRPQPDYIPVEVYLHVGLFFAEATNDLRFRYHLEVAFWNPYTAAIHLGATDGSLRRPCEIQFHGLPQIRLRNRSMGDVEILTVDMEDTIDYQWQDGYWRAWIDLGHGSELVRIEPGTIQRRLEPSHARGLVRLLPDRLGKRILDPGLFLPGNELELELLPTASNDHSRIELWLLNEYDEPESLSFVINQIQWPSAVFAINPDNFHLSRSEDYRVDQAVFTLGLKLLQDANGPSHWMRGYDLRSGVIDCQIASPHCSADSIQFIGVHGESEFPPGPVYIHVSQLVEDSLLSFRYRYHPGNSPLILGEQSGLELNCLLDDSWPLHEIGTDRIERYNVNELDGLLWARILFDAHASGYVSPLLFSLNSLLPSIEDWLPLGNSIAHILRQRKTPFSSVAEFLQAGVVEQALIASGMNDPPIPGGMTQGDVLAPILWNLTTRSDTFIIEVNCRLQAQDNDSNSHGIFGKGMVQRVQDSTDRVGDQRSFELLAWQWEDPE
jgi:hypothetical protein